MEFAAGVAVTSHITLVRPLREGAMGRLWVARHAQLRREVAVKFMARKLARDKGMVARFNREAEAAAQITNPHVVQILEHGTTEDATPFIAMELLSGETLGECLEREGRVGLLSAAAILRQVGSALDAAHARGIVHRDIKPDNLFLVRDSPQQPMVKVLDFGMAKRVRKRNQSIVTATGVAVGTPEYMSPEQVLGAKDVDFRSDLWALAVVAYNMMTGETAFEAATPHALFFTICKGHFTPLARHGAPMEFEPWFKRAFQPAKERRFGSAREMVLRFEACVSEARAAGYDDDDETQALAPTAKLRVLERFGVPPAPESQTNPRIPQAPDSVDHLASTLDFRAEDIEDEDSDEDGIATHLVSQGDTAQAIREALSELGNPMGEDIEPGPESQTNVRSYPSAGRREPAATIGDRSVSGYDKTVNSQRNPFAELEDPVDSSPESESVPGVAKPRVPRGSDAPIDYGDADESGPRPSLASHSPDASGARISVSAREADQLTDSAGGGAAAAARHSPAPADAEAKSRTPYIMVGGLAAVAAVVIFVVTSSGSTSPHTATQTSPATEQPANAQPEKQASPATTAAAANAPSVPTEPAAAPTAESKGNLTIICKPQCINVRLGDTMLGPSPLLKKEVPAGKHRLTLIRAGHSPSVVEIEVGAGEHLTRSFNTTTESDAPPTKPANSAPPMPPPEPVVEDPYENEQLPIAPGETALPPLPVGK